MRRPIAYAALASTAGWAIYGFVHGHLFEQSVWSGDGIARFLAYSVAYWIIAIAVMAIRRAWFLPALAVLSFGYSTWWCAVHFHWWAPAAVLYFLGSCWMLGRFFARGMIGLIAGLAIWVFAISIAVHFAINRPAMYAIAFALPYLAQLNPVVARRQAPPVMAGFAFPQGSWGIAVLGYLLGAHWLVALGPEISSDGLAMHLAIPSMIARDRLFGFDFQQYFWALMPTGGDFAYTAAYLLGGEAAARLLNFTMLALLAALVYRASQRWVSESIAALGAALFVSTPLVQLVTGSLFVENIWAVFIGGAALSLAEGSIALGGLLTGAALATKFGTTAYLVPALAISAFKSLGKNSFHRLKPVPLGSQAADSTAWHRLQPVGSWFKPARWKTFAIAAALLILFAAPPYWNAWRKSGNPLFPFENQVFRSKYIEPVDIMHDVAISAPARKNGFYDATFRSSRYIEGQDGSLGFQYFLLLPAAVILWNKRTPAALLLFALAGAAITFITVPNIRYLYPSLPLLSIGFAWLASEISWLPAAMIGLIALNLCFLPAAGWYHKEFAPLTRAQWTDYMTLHGPHRELTSIVDRTSPGEPVTFFRGEDVADLRAKSYSDTWHSYHFWKRMIESDDAAQVTALFHEFGIRHVITPMPPDSSFEVVRDFINNWTAPSGASRGRVELRTVLPTRAERLRDIQPVSAGAYDDRDWRIEYFGAWLHDRQFRQASEGSITYTKIAGDSARLFFTGTSIDYVYTKAPNRGIAEVWIDRRKLAEIDEYSPSIEWQRHALFSGLETGPHTIEVRVAGRKNADSADVFVDVDTFIVK